MPYLLSSVLIVFAAGIPWAMLFLDSEFPTWERDLGTTRKRQIRMAVGLFAVGLILRLYRL